MKILVTLILLDVSLTLNYLQGRLHSRFEDNDRAHELLSCVTAAMRRLFEPGDPITIIVPKDSLHNYEEDHLFQKLAKHTSRVRIYREYKHIPQHERSLEQIPQFLVFSMTQDQLEKDFNERLYRVPTKFLVVTNASADWLHDFTRRLNQTGYKRIAFLLQNPAGNLKSGHIVSCKELLKNVKRLQFLKPHHTDVLTYARVAYKHSSNITKHKFEKVGKLSLGLEIMRIIVKKLSIKLDLQNIHNPSVAIDRLRHGLTNVLYIQVTDVSVKHLTALEIIWVKNDAVYITDRIRQTSLSDFELLKVFDINVWCCIIFAYIMTTLFALCLNKLRARGPRQEYLKLWSILLITCGQAIPRLPRKIGLRFYVGMWLCFVYYLNMSFTTTYSSFVTGSKNAEFLKTYEDVIASRRTILGSQSFVDTLRNSPDPVMIELASRCEVKPYQEALESALDSDSLSLQPQTYIITSNFLNRANPSRQLYILQDTQIATYPFVFLMKKNEFPNREFQKIYWNLREMGILAEIEEKVNMARAGKRKTGEPNIEKSTIKLGHLMPMFGIISIGYVIAIIVFFFEILIHKLQRRR